MKVQVKGKASRSVTNEKTGRITVYTNLFYETEFTPAEAENGAIGIKCDRVNTSLDCSKIQVDDIVLLDYGPTGYKNSDGTDQIRLQSIDILGKAK